MKKYLSFAIAAFAAVMTLSCVKDNPIEGGGEENPPAPSAIDGLCINEVWPNQKKVEFYNAGKTELDLSGYTLKKDDDESTAWSFPTVEVPVGGFVVYTCKSTDLAEGPTFGLSETKGFKLELFDATGKSIDCLDNTGSVKYSFTDTQSTLGRKTDGDLQWVIFSPGTIGASNKGGTFVENWGEEVVPPAPAAGVEKLILNEINGNDKFIEIFNPTKDAIAINGIKILKDLKDVWTAPDIKIEGGAYLLLYSTDVTAAGQPKEGYDATLTFNSGLSAKKAVRVQLVQTDATTVIDDFNLVTHPTGSNVPGSYGRNADGKWYIQETPTPGAANVDGTTVVVLGE